jgi:hypothetical protein
VVSVPDDLNAAHTADQWLEQDLRAICALMGTDEIYTEQTVHDWSGSGLDYLAARAEWALKDL